MVLFKIASIFLLISIGYFLDTLGKERQKEVKQFILGYLPEESRTGEVNTLNFVDSGLLDSFGILTMVMDIESCFSVKLSPEILLKPEAKTVQGLASLVVSEMDND